MSQVVSQMFFGLFFGRAVTEWLNPPLGPPYNNKTTQEFAK